MAFTILIRNPDVVILEKLKLKVGKLLQHKKIRTDPQLVIVSEDNGGYAIGSTAPEYEDLAFIEGLLLGLYHGDTEA